MSRLPESQDAHQSTPQATPDQPSARSGQSTPAAHMNEVLSAVRAHCRRELGMQPPELERLADLLLRVFGGDPEYPVRADLEHRTIGLHSLQDQRDPLARAAHRQPAPPEETSPPLQALIARLLVTGRVRSRRRREVARLHLWGYTLSQIATMLDLPLSTVRSRWAAARKQLQGALSDLPRDGLSDLPDPAATISTEDVAATFRAEQCPPRYEPPRHCPAGKERCARTGVCRKVPGGDPWR